MQTTFRHRITKRSSEDEAENYSSYMGKSSVDIEVYDGVDSQDDEESATDEGGYDMEYLINILIQNSTDFHTLVAQKVKDTLLNDTVLNSVYEHMFTLYQRLTIAEEKINLLAATTPRPFSTTTSNYLNSDVDVNNQINAALNRLVELQFLHGLKFKDILNPSTVIDDLTISSQPTVNSEVKETLKTLSLLSAIYPITLKEFFEKLP